MKKYIAMILIAAVCICALSGCAEKKTFDVTQNTEKSVEAETDTETKTDTLSETSAESENLSEKAYTWGDISFVLTEITEDLGDMRVGSGPADNLPSPEGKWVRVAFTITEGEPKCGELLKVLGESGNIKLDDYTSTTASIQGIHFDDPDDPFNSATYAGVDSTMNLFFDVDESFDINAANVFVNENVTIKDEAETGATAEVGSVDGITVISGTVGKPGQGKMAYAPSGASGYFAVDGTLKAQSTIRICVDPNGILNYDLAMKLDSAMEVDAEIQVLKDDVQLVSYAEKGLSLPAGETVINACVDTKESAPCSGEYMVRFYINGCLISEDTGTV